MFLCSIASRPACHGKGIAVAERLWLEYVNHLANEECRRLSREHLVEPSGQLLLDHVHDLCGGPSSILVSKVCVPSHLRQRGSSIHSDIDLVVLDSVNPGEERRELQQFSSEMRTGEDSL